MSQTNHQSFVRKISKVVGATLIGSSLFGLAATSHAAGSLNVYNWAEYIGEETIANFAKEYDVDVTYDNYDSVETADAKLLSGNSGYDVVSHSGSSLARLIPTGKIVQKLDKSRLDNWKNLDSDVVNQLATFDPGNEHVVPYLWGTHGVTYNRELILATNPDAPIGSMDLIFNPEELAKIAECGVAMLDSPTDVVPMALAYLGLDPASKNKADYDKVGELLASIRPYLKTFDNYAYQRMPEKEFCLAVTWGPDGLLAMSGAVEANTGVVLDFFVPSGQNAAQFWVDGWVIPQDAKNVENAYLFLNYMMRPEVAAADSNFTWYATANSAAWPNVDKEVIESPASYPTPEQVAKMYALTPIPPKVERARTRAWTNFKAAN